MADLEPRFGHEDVDILQRETLYQGFFELHRLRLRHRIHQGGWSDELQRELFVREDVVCALLYDPDRETVVLLEQFRVGALKDVRSPWMLELVAGIVEAGETKEAVAERETQEESGAQILDLISVCDYHVSPGGSQEMTRLFCARVDSRELGGYHGLAHEGEDIRVIVVPELEAYQALTGGRIRNAHTLIALQWLWLNREQLKQRWCNPGGPSEA